MEQTYRIEVGRCPTRGDVRPLAEHLFQRALEFFADPENEREFQEWKKKREEAKHG
jgi:hypothetical protein